MPLTSFAEALLCNGLWVLSSAVGSWTFTQLQMLPLHNKIKLSWEPQHALHPLGGISNTTRCQATVRRKTGSVVRSLEQSVLTKTRWVKFASVFSLICSPQNKYNIINQVRTTQKAFFTLAIFKKFVYKALQTNPCCPIPNC